MRNQLTLIFMLTMSLTVYSQEYKRFKVALGIPLAVVTMDQFNFYGGFYLEPSYRIGSRPVGFYLSVMGSDGSTNENPDENLSETAVMLNACAVLDQYFKTSKPRVFTGLMVGSSYHTLQTVPRFGGAIEHVNRSGVIIAPRVGLNYGHFRMMMMYQVISGGITDLLCVQVGIEIGGGKKSKREVP